MTIEKTTRESSSGGTPFETLVQFIARKQREGRWISQKNSVTVDDVPNEGMDIVSYAIPENATFNLFLASVSATTPIVPLSGNPLASLRLGNDVEETAMFGISSAKERFDARIRASNETVKIRVTNGHSTGFFGIISGWLE